MSPFRMLVLYMSITMAVAIPAAALYWLIVYEALS